MDIYFSGSIAGGREKVEDYAKIVEILKEYGNVLTTHIADTKLGKVEKGITDKQIYQRDTNWLKQSDMVLAEITVPSLGVGYELAYAEKENIPVICMYEKNKNVSRMITGNKNFILIPYEKVEELRGKIQEIMKEFKEE